MMPMHLFVRCFLLIALLFPLMVTATPRSGSSPSTLNSSTITWQWDSELYKLLGHSTHLPSPIQIDPPCHLQTAPLLYSYKNHLCLIATHASHPLLHYFLSPKTHSWDFWIYTIDSGKWHLCSHAITQRVVRWLHQFSIQTSFVGDVLIESESKGEREWVRYWAGLSSSQVQKNVIYRGDIQAFSMRPDPVNGTFRYAYLLLGSSTLVKYDLFRNSQRSIQLPIQAHSMDLMACEPYYLEDDVKLQFREQGSAESKQVTIEGIQLSICEP